MKRGPYSFRSYRVPPYPINQHGTYYRVYRHGRGLGSVRRLSGSRWWQWCPVGFAGQWYGQAKTMKEAAQVLDCRGPIRDPDGAFR